MLRYLLVFAAGAPFGWTVHFYKVGDGMAVLGCLFASFLFLVAATYAKPRRLPEQRLQSHLMGLRLVDATKEERR